MKVRLVIVFFFLAAATLVAQTFRGTILGTVTDPSEKFVFGATVKVRNVGTGQERTTTTSADGSYAISELPIGTYSVTVTQSGFQTSVTNTVEVNVATERRVDVQLKMGQVSQKVEVSGEALSADRNHLGRTGRNPDQRYRSTIFPSTAATTPS